MARYVRTAVNVPSLTGVFVEGCRGPSAHARLTFDYEVPAALRAHDPGRAPGAGAVRQSHCAGRGAGRGGHTGRCGDTSHPAARRSGAGVDPGPDRPGGMAGAANPCADQRRDRTLPSCSDWRNRRTRCSRLAADGARRTSRRPWRSGSSGALRARGPLRGRQIDRLLPGLDWRRSAQIS